MKKIIRLTESDLTKLVNKVLKEQAKFEFDPKDLEMPDEDKLRDMFLSKDVSPEVEKMGGDFKKAMSSCVSERNLYKVGGLLKNIETKKSNILNTIVAMLFDSKMGGKSIGQEFNEFSDCINKKIGGKMSGVFEQSNAIKVITDKVVSSSSSAKPKGMTDKVVSSSSSEKPKGMTDKVVSSSSSKKYNVIGTCASMGVKTPGYCDTEGKKPVKWCASMGVKTIGYCYVDSKKPISNPVPHSKDSIKE
jgi:ABC-type antimicrobial peptide transport system permease subunit